MNCFKRDYFLIQRMLQYVILLFIMMLFGVFVISETGHFFTLLQFRNRVCAMRWRNSAWCKSWI